MIFHYLPLTCKTNNKKTCLVWFLAQINQLSKVWTLRKKFLELSFWSFGTAQYFFPSFFFFFIKLYKAFSLTPSIIPFISDSSQQIKVPHTLQLSTHVKEVEGEIESKWRVERWSHTVYMWSLCSRLKEGVYENRQMRKGCKQGMIKMTEDTKVL